MNYKEIKKYVETLALSIKSTDSRFNRYVDVICNDGTILNLPNTFVFKYEEWYIVISEHQGHFIYNEEDIYKIHQYERIEIENEEYYGRKVCARGKNYW